MKAIKFRPLVLVVAIAIISTMTITVLAANSILPGIFSTAREKGFYNAIFDRDGVIYYYDGLKNSISPIGENGLPKYGPVVSPDSAKILYRHSVLETSDNTLQVGVMDFNGETLLEVIVDSRYSNDIIGLEWLNDDSFAVIGHVNPSSSEYFIFDARTGNELMRFAGYGFSQLPGNKGIIYAENIPHGFADQAYHSYFINNEKVYTSDVLGATLSKVSFSADGAMFAFIETPSANLIDADSLEPKVIFGTFDENNLSIHPEGEVLISDDVSGFLSFDEQNNICFVERDKKFTLDSEGEFVEGKITTDIRDASSDSKYFEDLQQGIKMRFGDTSLEEIYDITWMP